MKDNAHEPAPGEVWPPPIQAPPGVKPPALTADEAGLMRRAKHNLGRALLWLLLCFGPAEWIAYELFRLFSAASQNSWDNGVFGLIISLGVSGAYASDANQGFGFARDVEMGRRRLPENSEA